MAGIKGLDLGLGGDGWLAWGQILFTTSAVIWLAILVPIQIFQHREAKIFNKSGEIPPAYWRRNKIWYFWGIIATLLPLSVLFLMVVK